MLMGVSSEMIHALPRKRTHGAAAPAPEAWSELSKEHVLDERCDDENKEDEAKEMAKTHSPNPSIIHHGFLSSWRLSLPAFPFVPHPSADGAKTSFFTVPTSSLTGYCGQCSNPNPITH